MTSDCVCTGKINHSSVSSAARREVEFRIFATESVGPAAYERPPADLVMQESDLEYNELKFKNESQGQFVRLTVHLPTPARRYEHDS